MDYKHRVPGNRSRKPRRRDRTGLVAGVMVAVTTAAVAIWLFSGHNAANPPGEDTAQAPAATATPQSGAAKTASGAAAPQPHPVPTPKPQEPRFSFYKILPEKEVIIAEHEIKTLKREESLGKKPPTGGQYLLQAGSFTRLEDAEKLRARLSQLQVKAKIESVRIENADWHRVKLGPFDSLVSADRVRVYLRSRQIDSVVQKSTQK
ncbi:SPOR domain-containing protein [Methyloterricola oryzae]|uniref:SPOR domain-containing protein n=1 Tax=Methyloterricola oryzae TaxID=1495050 RepID=UPI0005EBB00C|nr:SPOR domain-containing protein [Methyloterricola oryzae]